MKLCGGVLWWGEGGYVSGRRNGMGGGAQRDWGRGARKNKVPSALSTPLPLTHEGF